MSFELPTPPKNGRIDRYEGEFKIIFEKLKASNFSEIEPFEAFMFRILKDCEIYLGKELGANFPSMQLTYYYNKDEYIKMSKKLDLIFGTRPYTIAQAFNLGSGVNIIISIQDCLKGNFVANLCISFIEELIHIMDSTKSELQIHDIVCSMLEGFLEVKIPENIKNERLRYSKECEVGAILQQNGTKGPQPKMRRKKPKHRSRPQKRVLRIRRWATAS